MKLSKAEALALAEFAGIHVFSRDGVEHACHSVPWGHMRLLDYLLTAEGALRVLMAADRFEVRNQRHKEGIVCLVWLYFSYGNVLLQSNHYKPTIHKDLPTAIITAALTLPAVQELVKKYQGENND